MQERRKHVRTEFSGHVKVMHPAIPATKMEMRDLSDGGIFVFVPGDITLEVGDTVKVQSVDIDDAPLLSAQIVRRDEDGIALMFVDL